MKTLLIIGYLGLYRTGSKRVIGLANYLPEFGWQPIIVTAPLERRPPQNVCVIETGYEDKYAKYRKIAKIKELWKPITPVLNYVEARCAEIATYPDSEIKWAENVNKVIPKIIADQKIDAIMSIYPQTSHFIAHEWSKRLGVKWLADFPDLWSANHNSRYSKIRKWFDKRLEVKTLTTADLLVTASEPMADKIRKIHRDKKVYAIPLGYNPNDINVPPQRLTDKFTITYTGMIYENGHNVDKLLVALNGLLDDEVFNVDDIEVRFYGKESEKLNRLIKKYRLSSVVKVYGEVSHEVALEKQRESQVLLLLDWNDPREKGLYSGKVFEYLAAYRPILATGGVSGNVVDKLLIETMAGVQAVTVEDIKRKLIMWNYHYKIHGNVPYFGIKKVIQNYSHREMSRKFAELLNG